MRYSFVFATLAASAIATPYIAVEVSEPGELVHNLRSKHHHKHRENDRDRDHGVRRGHRGGRNEEDDEDEGRDNGWFSSLWRKNRDDKDNNRRGHHGRRGGRRDRDRDYDDEDDDFHTNTLLDDLFGSDYECVIQATSQQKERKDARECCQQIGGELYDVAGRCVFRDVYENPREDWRTCAMRQEGAVFADCYYREQREVDDELSSRRRRTKSRSRSGSRDDEDREDRKRRHRHDRDGRGDDHDSDRNGRDRDNGDRQVFLGRDGQDDNGRSRRGRMEFECKLDLNDQNREKEITRECCNQRNVDGQLTQGDQRCEMRRDDNADEFEECAEEQGVQQGQIQCYPIHNHQEF